MEKIEIHSIEELDEIISGLNENQIINLSFEQEGDGDDK